MSTLPIDLLVHVISPFFRFWATEGEDGTGANAGHRLLQLCRLTAAQKKQMTDNMMHPAFEFACARRGLRRRAIGTDMTRSPG